jgi:uncharacterized Zn finger protein
MKKPQRIIGWPPDTCPNCDSKPKEIHIREELNEWIDGACDGYTVTKIVIKCAKCGTILQESVDF